MRIIRIIGYSILILVLSSILILGIGVKEFAFQEMGEAETSAVFVSPEQVRRISIDWTSGKVTVRTANVSEITLTETRDTNSPTMTWRIDGDQLEVDFQKERHIQFWNSGTKDLLVEIPQDWDCEELEVDVSSATVLVENVTVDNLELDSSSGDSILKNCTMDDLHIEATSSTLLAEGLNTTRLAVDHTSGDCTFTDCTIGQMELDITSGDTRFSGYLEELDFESTSGDLELATYNCPSRMILEATSGDLDVTLPDTCGFKATVHTTSGNFHSDFPTEINRNVYTAGDGTCHIKANTTSGSFTIHKGDAPKNCDH